MVQMKLAQNMDGRGTRTNATLRDDEWREVDDEVVRVARQRLNGIADLRDRGLVHNVSDIGVFQSQFEDVSDMNSAETSMMGEAEDTNEETEYSLNTVPMPVIFKQFLIPERKLEASRRRGEDLEMTKVSTATRKVRDKLEDMLFNGETSVSVGGNSIDGYTTFSDRDTSVSASGDWGTKSNIIPTVTSMIDAAESNNFFGPYILYAAQPQFAEMRAYEDNVDRQIKDRVENLEQIDMCKPADVLSDGEVLLVQPSRDVVDLAMAQDIRPIQWESGSGMTNYFRVQAIMAPRMKSDTNSNTGIVHVTDA